MNEPVNDGDILVKKRAKGKHKNAGAAIESCGMELKSRYELNLERNRCAGQAIYI